MTIRRAPRHHKFVTLNSEVLNDVNISWDAKGLWAYLMAQKDDWKILPGHLAKRYKGAGRDKIYRILKELIGAGLAERIQQRSRLENGREVAGSSEYIIYDTCQLEDRDQDKIKGEKLQLPENQYAENQCAQKPDTKLILSKTNNKSLTETEPQPGVSDHQKSEAPAKKPPKKLSFRIGFNRKSTSFTNIGQSDYDRWAELFPGVDIPRQLKLCAEWAMHNDRKSWGGTITTWLSKCHKDVLDGRSNQSSGKGKSNSNPCLSDDERSQYHDVF